MWRTIRNARYVVAGSGAMANGGRNTFPLNPIDNIDIAVKKRFSFHERYSFDFGAQFYNILNHPQFTGGFNNDVAVNSSSARATIWFPAILCSGDSISSTPATPESFRCSLTSFSKRGAGLRPAFFAFCAQQSDSCPVFPPPFAPQMLA